MATFLSDVVTNHQTASNSSIQPTASYVRTAGSCAIAIVGWFTGDDDASVSDDSGGGHTWTSVTAGRLAYPAQSMWLQMFYAKNIGGSGACTITANFGAAAEYRSIIVFGVSGLSTTAPLGSVTTQVVSSTNAPATASSLTVDGAGMSIAGIASYSAVGTYTPQNGFTGDGVALQYLDGAYKAQTGGGSQAIAWSSTQTTTYLIIAASFLDGGSYVPTQTLTPRFFGFTPGFGS